MNEFSVGPMSPIHGPSCRRIRLHYVDEFSVSPIHGPPCRRIRLRSVDEFSVSPIHGPPSEDKVTLGE